DEAAEQGIEALGVFAIAEVSSLVDDMHRGPPLVRADHVEQIECAFDRDGRIIIAEDDLGRSLQAALAQPVERLALLFGELRRKEPAAGLLIDHLLYAFAVFGQ